MLSLNSTSVPQALPSGAAYQMRNSWGNTLRTKRFLVVEDDYFVAHEVQRTLLESGAQTVDCASSTAQAVLALDRVCPDGAVLDINLSDRDVFPFADELVARGIPFLFYTGYDEIIVPARFAMMPRIEKPATGAEIIKALTSIGVVERAQAPTDVVGMLPQLRGLAFAYIRDRDESDRLVEAVLRQAIEAAETGDVPADIEQWLRRLITRAADEAGNGRLT